MILGPERNLNRLKGNQAKFKAGSTFTFCFPVFSFVGNGACVFCLFEIVFEIIFA
jgi:hypothetical protein